MKQTLTLLAIILLTQLAMAISTDSIRFKKDTVLISVTTKNVSCNGYGDGYAIATPDSGIAPFTYSWSDGGVGAKDQDLFPGSYTVYVTDSIGKSDSAMVTITEPKELKLGQITTPKTSICPGDTITLTVLASGGTVPYTINWLGPFLNLGYKDSIISDSIKVNPYRTTDYYVQAWDNNGCSVSYDYGQGSSITIKMNPVPQGVMGPDSVCSGDSIKLTAIGGSGFKYDWVPTMDTAGHIYVKTAGIYSVNVTTDLGCTGSFTKSLTVNPVPSVPKVVYDGNVMFSSGSPKYQWFWDDSILMPGETGQVCIPTWNYGTYEVLVTNNHGCSTMSVPYNIDSTTGIDQINAPKDYSANITGGVFYYKSQSPELIRLCDLSGRIIYQGATDKIEINLQTTGMYILQTSQGNDKLFNLK